MKPVISFLFIALWGVLHAGQSLAHEYWIAPQAYQVGREDNVVADLVNGQKFTGTKLPYLPANALRFELARDGAVQPVAARAGDRPAFDTPAPEGLVVLVYRSSLSSVHYRDWDKFAGFVDHKDLGVTRADHLAAGRPDGDFREAYARFSKALVAVGHGRGADVPLGLETELVALANPYVAPRLQELPVRLLYRGQPRIDAQIEVFARAPDGEVTIFTLRTDAGGVARVPLRPGSEYMLDAVLLRLPDADTAAAFDAVYETLWANLTFAAPPSE